jgi:hypothetical protein
MILEETSGNVTVTLEGKQVVVGTYFEDSKYPLVSVVGAGNAVFRTGPSTTIERKGVEFVKTTEMRKDVEIPTSVPPAPVQAATVAERIPPAVATPGQTTQP